MTDFTIEASANKETGEIELIRITKGAALYRMQPWYRRLLLRLIGRTHLRSRPYHAVFGSGLDCNAWRRSLRQRLFWWFYEADIGLWVALAIVIGLWFISRGN